MEKLLTFKSVARENIFVENIFYGREIKFSIPCEDRLFLVKIGRHNAKFSIKLLLNIGEWNCELFLENIPSIENFSNKFTGIDIFLLPKELHLMILRNAFDEILNYFSSKLGVDVNINAIEILSEYDRFDGVDFELVLENEHIVSGSLVAPKEILAKLSKNIKSTDNLRTLNSLKIPYKFCVGSTDLSREDYSNLAEGDIIFLDQHELAKGKKVNIVGFGPINISGKISPEGVVVDSIS